MDSEVRELSRHLSKYEFTSASMNFCDIDTEIHASNEEIFSELKEITALDLEFSASWCEEKV